MNLSWPLIGRSQEMQAVEAAIVDPDVSGIVIHGAAGVGKSRIAREALSEAASKGYEVRWAVGTSSARTIPLGAFNAWVQSGITDTVQLLRGVIASLTTAPAGKTVVLAVDDVQLLDDLSIFVVSQIAQRGVAKLILTVLDDEPIPAAVQEIWRVSRFRRLKPEPLSVTETATLVSTVLGGPVDPEAIQKLWNLTRGNALYLRNIVEQEVGDRRLVQERAYWRWIGDPTMPPGLIEMIESRIGGLPAAVNDVIDVLAVGEPIDLETLRRITEPSGVEEADNLGLISLEPVDGNIDVRVAHPLYGEVRRRRAAATRLRRLRGLIAAELAKSERRDDIQAVVRRATLSIDSDLEPDAGLLVRAAHGAVGLGDLALADRLAAAALRAGAGPEPNFLRAHALSWNGRGDEAEAVLADIPVAELTDNDRARVAFLRASNMLWALGEPARAKELIDAASNTAPPEARSYIDAFLAVYWFATDQPQASAEASKNITLADLPVVGAEIAWTRTAICADAGRLSDALDAADAGYAVAARSFDAPHMRFNIADAHLSALLLAGRANEAVAVAERMRQEAADLPGAGQLLGAALAGRAALGAGHLKDACTLLEQAAVGLSASHPRGWGYRYQIPYATALAIQGSPRAAAATLATLDNSHRAFRLLDYERSLAGAWLTAVEGAVTKAIAILQSAADRAAANGQFAAEVLCLQTATQFGDHTTASRLRELESIVEGPRVGIAARFSEALHDGNASQLSTLSEEFERIGDLVAAVDAAARAALVYRRQDLRGSALSCAGRAQALAQQCGGLSTPALRQASEPLPLTDREAEIVMLIGEGLTNRAVAERLTVSVRTVESHIYRAMLKTGTTSREELAALLPRPSARTD